MAASTKGTTGEKGKTGGDELPDDFIKAAFGKKGVTKVRDVMREIVSAIDIKDLEMPFMKGRSPSQFMTISYLVDRLHKAANDIYSSMKEGYSFSDHKVEPFCRALAEIRNDYHSLDFKSMRANIDYCSNVYKRWHFFGKVKDTRGGITRLKIFDDDNKLFIFHECPPRRINIALPVAPLLEALKYLTDEIAPRTPEGEYAEVRAAQPRLEPKPRREDENRTTQEDYF